MSEITAKLNKASKEIEQDFEELRHTVKNEGVKVRTIVDLALGFFMARMKKRTVARKPKVVVTEEETLQ